MAFLGNHGAAKTTVARIVGRRYKAIGLLSKGQFIEASRTDLIAEYQGQTAIKVKRLINRAKGGVLFIVELKRCASQGIKKHIQLKRKINCKKLICNFYLNYSFHVDWMKFTSLK